MMVELSVSMMVAMRGNFLVAKMAGSKELKLDYQWAAMSGARLDRMKAV